MTPDYPMLERALLDGAGFLSAVEHPSEEAVLKTIMEAAVALQHPDGSCRFQNKFRHLIAHA